MANYTSVKALLRDPQISMSTAWEALRKLYGRTVTDWEPDTFAYTLHKAEVPPTASLMSKILAAQTVAISNVCLHDHEAFFGVALACDGIAAISGQYLHPTPEEMVAAVDEISVIRGKTPNNDEGFDPDEVDAAIAGVLAMDGFYVTPDGLNFAQDSLDKLTPGVATPMREHCKKLWAELKDLAPRELLERANHEENMVGVQLHRLADIQMARRLRAEERVAFHKALIEMTP